MDVFDCIYTRRSIRKFKDVPVELDKLYEILKAGSYAPCAGDLQNWKFIVEKNIDKIQSMYYHTLEQEAFMTAQIAIIVVAETAAAEKFYGLRGKRLYAVQNCAAAMQNMLLAAHALGLGAVWIGAFDENRINDMYKIPSVARAQGIILLGYPDEEPAPRHVKYIWYTTNYNRYGMKYEHLHRIANEMAIEWEIQSKNLKRSVNRHLNKAKEKLGITREEERGERKKGVGEERRIREGGSRIEPAHQAKGVKGLLKRVKQALPKREKKEKQKSNKPFLQSLKKKRKMTKRR